MKNLRHFALGAILHFLSCSALSQTLTIGQQLPLHTIENIINSTGGSINTGNWQGKAVLLVFWNLQCKATLRAIDSLSAIQRHYTKDLQIVLVNKESEMATRKLLLQRYGRVPANLTFITGDTVLRKFFPHFLVSHNVWISKDGIVRHITKGQYTTLANLSTFLSGRQLTLPLKTDIAIDEKLPLLSSAGTKMNDVIFYSTLLPGITNASSGVSYQRVGGSTSDNRIRVNNYTLNELLTLAYSERGRFDYDAAGRVIFEDGLDTTWLLTTPFAFELQVPIVAASNFYNIMQQHLLQALGLQVLKERRLLPCLVLRFKGENGKPILPGLPAGTDMKEVGGKKIWYFRNTSAPDFIANLKSVLLAWNEKAPLVDATSFEGLVNVDLDAKLFDSYDLAFLQRELAKAGWELNLENFMTEALVVRRAGGTSF